MPISSRRSFRLLAVSVLTGLSLTLAAGVASAHVSVNPDTATAGSYTKLTFRVPNESAKASTTGLTVTIPADHPFAFVAVKKQLGWTATMTKVKLAKPIASDDATITEAVSTITWKADATGKIALGEFAEFDVEVGPIPDVASLAFTAVQTYDDGSVVHWDEATPASGEEPEHPAPTLAITEAGAEADHHGATPVTSAATPTTATVTPSLAAVASSGGGSDGSARTLGVVGIVIGALGLLVAAVSLRRRGAVPAART